MVFIRALLPLATLAAAVLAAPAGRRDLSVNSGGSSCSGSNCGSDSSSMSMGGCSGGSCDSSSSSSSMDCGSGGCGGSSDSSSTMSMDCGSGGCDSSSTTMSMDCGSGGCGGSSSTMTDSASSSMDCGSGGCGGSMSTMTDSASSSMATMMYGSGSSNWGMYQSCVDQCVATYGGNSGSSNGMNMGSSDSSSSSGGDAALNSPTATIGSGGSNGVTHTVVVAPTAGVLRFVPFAVEAAVGDTVEYIWGADLHTVTKGSALQLCNQSQDSATFNTGLQNHSFSYLQAVNDTKPTYFYCAHPGHCAKGMFGVINPLSSDDPALQAGSAQTMNATMMGSASTMSAMAYAQSVMANGTSPAANSLAAKWGASYSLADIPPAMHGAFVENVAFTRALIAMNPDLVQNGKLAMSTTGAPVMYPVDVAGAANAAANLAAAPAANAAAAAPSSSSAAAAATSSAAGKKNGARGLAAPAATVVFALAVSLLAL